METRIESVKNFRICGFAVETCLNDCDHDTALLWDEYKNFLQSLPRADSFLYGAMWYTEGDRFNYMLGVKQPQGLAFVVMPDDTGYEEKRLYDTLSYAEIADGEFAVAKIPEGMSAVEAWTVFWNDAIPKKGYKPDKAHGKYFELYDENGSREFWAPVNPALALSPALQEISRIEGINVTPALKLLMGKQRILEMAVKSVGASMNSRLDVMAEKLRNGMLNEFRNDIHGLKGSLAQIGADACSASAARLEAAAKTEDAEYCAKNFPCFAKDAETLGKMINGIFMN